MRTLTTGDVLLEFAAHDVRKDLELPVLVRAEAGLGVDAVLVDDTKRAESFVVGVLMSGRDSAPLFCRFTSLE